MNKKSFSLSILFSLLFHINAHVYGSDRSDPVSPAYSVSSSYGGINLLRDHFEKIQSTQVEARHRAELILKGEISQSHLDSLTPETWSLITAGMQTNGVGQGKNSWNSPEGNIYATYTFMIPNSTEDDRDSISNTMAIPQVTALSIAHMLEKYGMDAQIKWVNDVLVDHKKISGILSESPGVVKVGESWYRVILLGIGINVNAAKKELSHISQPATSMRETTGKDFDVNEVLDTLSGFLIPNITHLIKNGFSADIHSSIKDKLENFGHNPVIFDRGFDENRYIVGQIEGMGPAGELLLKRSDSQETSPYLNGRILKGKDVEVPLFSEFEKDLIHRLIKTDYFDEIKSTQQYARENLGLVEDNFWHAIRAGFQTDGIGRNKVSKWYAEKNKSILVTYMIPYVSTYMQTQQASLVAALSVVQTFQEYGCYAGIKWRNDVMVGGKTAGIFSESLDHPKGNVFLIGIGININQEEKDLLSIGQPANSLKAATSAEEEFDLNEVYDVVSRHLYFNLNIMNTFGFDRLKPEIEAQLTHIGERISVKERGSDEILTGKMLGINAEGGLRLEMEDGRVAEILEGRILKED